MRTLIEATFPCAACGEANDTLVDPSHWTGKQSYVEDCRVCCRPNVLSVSIVGERAEIKAELEGA